MRNQQQRAGIILQIILQPEQREQVEVVGRLVQQQQIRLHHQQPRQARAHDPAAAHLPRLPVEVRVAITQAAQHLLRLGLHLRVVQLVVLRVRLQIFRAGHIARLLQFVQPLFQPGQLLHPAGRHIQHRFLAQRLALLRQMAHHRPFIALHDARVRLPLLENDGEERRFARAVRADQRDAVAIIDLQRGVLEESAPANGHLKITNCQHEKRIRRRLSLV